MASVGVVIPTLNEASNLPGLLADLRDVASQLDITVVDGGSGDDTQEAARSAGARVLLAPRGRAAQMNAGARATETEWLCFLHADIRLPAAARQDLARVSGDRQTQAAVWRLAIDARGLWFRVIECGARIRDRIGGLPYGDQGLLIRRALFERVGGFPDIPVMEDVALVRAVGAVTSLRHLQSHVLVSARRWDHEGRYWAWLRNTALLTAYVGGVSPQRLARWYPPHRV